MKKHRILSWMAPVIVLAASSSLDAAVNITVAPNPDPFPAIPAAGDWSMLKVGTAGATLTATAFDTKVTGAADASTITGPLILAASIPPTASESARWNGGTETVPPGITFLQTRPTGGDYLLLMAHLVNATGGPLNAVQIKYDYSKGSVGDTSPEEIKGFRVYWSTTGTPGNWTLIPEFSVDTTGTYNAPQAMTAVINLPAALADGAPMYLLWADQNSVANPDASYHIDNFSASTVLDCSVTGTVSNVVRAEGVNAADPSDDTVSFTVTVAGTGSVAAGWIATAPASLLNTTDTYGTAHAFSNIPVSAFTSGILQLKVQDTGTPVCQTTINVVAPPVDVIGQYDIGSGPVDLLSAIGTTPAPEWVNDATARTLVMTTGIAADSVVTSQTLDLSAVGNLQFSATVHLAETSAGSNVETGDRFKAELIIDGTVHNLVSAWDSGDGAPSTVAPGTNGPANGYINGYAGAMGTNQITQTVYAAAINDYDDNLIRDEFNQAHQNAAVSISSTFPLSFSIPATANSVQLKIYGAGFSSTETLTVSDVKFGPAPATDDADGDGVSDTDEEVMGTDPNNAADVLRLFFNAANPPQIQFPAKAGRFYRLYVSDDTDGQDSGHLLIWKDAGAGTVTGGGGEEQFNVPVVPAEKRRFYRVHVMKADGPWPAVFP
ncbi:MAG TPA: hypothetical protein VHM91_09985 [Verrucomicrobiales bacterium]|nr:hypothetical protein [Verrucomicrobiales bacterium]